MLYAQDKHIISLSCTYIKLLIKNKNTHIIVVVKSPIVAYSTILDAANGINNKDVLLKKAEKNK